MNIDPDSDNSYLVSPQKIKDALVAFKNFFSGDDSKEVLSVVSAVSSTAKGVKLVVDVRNWHIARKIKSFVETLETQHLNTQNFHRLIAKYGQEKVYSNVILSLDSLRSEKHAEAYAFLFAALLNEKIDWKRFKELQDILEKIDPSALDEDFNGKEPSYKLVTVGLAYVMTVMNGVKLVPNGKLYNDFEQYIVLPSKKDS